MSLRRTKHYLQSLTMICLSRCIAHFSRDMFTRLRSSVHIRVSSPGELHGQRHLAGPESDTAVTVCACTCWQVILYLLIVFLFILFIYFLQICFCKRFFFLMFPNTPIIDFQVLQIFTYVFFHYLYGSIFLHRSLVYLEFILMCDEASATNLTLTPWK